MRVLRFAPFLSLVGVISFSQTAFAEAVPHADQIPPSAVDSTVGPPPLPGALPSFRDEIRPAAEFVENSLEILGITLEAEPPPPEIQAHLDQVEEELEAEIEFEPKWVDSESFEASFTEFNARITPGRSERLVVVEFTQSIPERTEKRKVRMTGLMPLQSKQVNLVEEGYLGEPEYECEVACVDDHCRYYKVHLKRATRHFAGKASVNVSVYDEVIPTFTEGDTRAGTDEILGEIRDNLLRDQNSFGKKEYLTFFRFPATRKRFFRMNLATTNLRHQEIAQDQAEYFRQIEFEIRGPVADNVTVKVNRLETLGDPVPQMDLNNPYQATVSLNFDQDLNYVFFSGVVDFHSNKVRPEMGLPIGSLQLEKALEIPY